MSAPIIRPLGGTSSGRQCWLIKKLMYHVFFFNGHSVISHTRLAGIVGKNTFIIKLKRNLITIHQNLPISHKSSSPIRATQCGQHYVLPPSIIPFPYMYLCSYSCHNPSPDPKHNPHHIQHRYDTGV